MPSRRHRARLTGTLLAALVSVATTTRSKEWVEVRSPHFIVLSDAGAQTAKRVARELERIRAVFEDAIPSMRHSPAPIQIYAVKDGESLEHLLPEYGSSVGARPPGLFRPGFGRNDILLQTDSRGEHPYSLLYHEYFHLLSRLNLPGVPLWLDEGLAEFWGHTVVRGRRAAMGLPSRDRLEPLRRRSPMPLTELLTAGRDSPLYREPDKRALFYAQAWALTHYLMLDKKGAHRGQLADYLDALRRGAGPERAAVSAFGELDALDKRLRDYVRQNRYLEMVIPAPPPIEESALELHELSEAEADAVQADFLVWGPSYDRARSLAMRANALSPELALPKEVMGALELRERELPRAWKWFVDAARSPGASHLAHFYAATLAPPSAKLDVEQSLLHAVAARPSFSPAYVELAYHYAGTGAHDKALAMVERAAELSPNSAWHRSLVARALWRVGHAADARRVMQEAVALALATGRPEEANDLCRYGSFAGMAESVVPACDRAVALRPDYGPYRDSRAVARAMIGDREGAVADLRAYLANDPRAHPTPDARERRVWIRRLEAGDAIFGEATRRDLLGRPF